MANEKPGITIESSIFIKRSKEDIWKYVIEFSNEKRWSKIVKDVGLTSEKMGPGATGYRILKRRGKFYWKITEWEEYRAIGFDYYNGIFKGSHLSMHLQPEDGGTRVISRGESPGSVRNRIFGIIIKPILARTLADNLKNLKAILEGQV